MAGLFVDTSALGRVLLREPDGRAIVTVPSAYDAWWSSELLVVELRRLAARAGLEVDAERLLASMRMAPVDRTTLERASRLEPVAVRSLDAVHLEAATRLGKAGVIEAVLTYDRQLQAGCRHHGLEVEAPVGHA